MFDDLGITEFVPGEVYYTIYPGEYIFKYVDKTCHYADGYIVDPYKEDPRFGTGRGGSDCPWELYKCRVATEIEKLWLEACTKNRTFVPLSNIPTELPRIKVSYTTINGEIKKEIIDGPLSNTSKLKDFKFVNYHINL